MSTKSYNSIYRGIVEDINDPLKLGRCKIRVPSIHGKSGSISIESLPWARYISPLPTGSNKGMFIIPEVGDIVWVIFEGGDRSYPVYIGSTYGVVGGVNEVPLTSEESPEDCEVLFSSKDIGGKRVQIKKDLNGLTVSLGDSHIKIQSSGDIDIYSNTNINLTCKNLNITQLDEYP